MKPIRILLVDDNPMFLGVARDFLQLQTNLSVVGTTRSGEEALNLAKELKPDIVLLDLNMPGLSGLEAIPRLREILPEIKVIALTMMDQAAYQPAALAAGADGFVPKASMCNDLMPAILDAISDKETIGT